MEQNDKVYFRHLGIEINTDCNLNCAHCYMGEKTATIIKPEYIDAIIANASGIDELTITGGEITLHLDILKMVLKKFAESGLKINYINLVTNGVICSQRLIDLFDWFRYQTTHPNDAILKISADEYHISCNPKFTSKELEQNINWYTERCKQTAPNYELVELDLVGNAEQLSKKDIKKYDYVSHYMQRKSNKSKCTFTEECDSKLCEHNIVNNCIRVIMLNADGYLYYRDSVPVNQRNKLNQTFSIGNVLDGKIIDMVKKYNSDCDESPFAFDKIIIKDTDTISLFKEVNYLTIKYVLIAKKVFNSNRVTNLFAKLEAAKTRNEITKATSKLVDYMAGNIESLDAAERYFCSIVKKDLDLYINIITKTDHFMIGDYGLEDWSKDADKFLAKKATSKNNLEEIDLLLQEAKHNIDIDKIIKLTEQANQLQKLILKKAKTGKKITEEELKVKMNDKPEDIEKITST